MMNLGFECEIEDYSVQIHILKVGSIHFTGKFCFNVTVKFNLKLNFYVLYSLVEFKKYCIPWIFVYLS